MKKFWIVFVVLVVVIGGGMLTLWKVVSGFQGAAVSIEGGVLVWKAGGTLVEERDESFIGQIRGGGNPTIQEILLSLKRAQTDDRIHGLALDMQGLKVDWAKLEELQTAVRDFAATGKPVVAYLDGGMTRDYALASQAPKVVLSPEANIMVLGVVAELDFLKNTLGKLGMEADFIHMGQYKSAPERMTRDSASAPNREMVNAIVDDRYEALLAMLSGGRHVDTQTAAAWVDQGMFDARGAVSAGMADTLMYWDDVLDHEFPDEPVTQLEDYILDAPHARKDSPKVALVNISGIIMPGPSKFDNLQGKIAGSKTVVDQLQTAGDDQAVKALVLRVDSPGGSALASDLIWNEIEKIKQKMPVIVSMSGMAASGGYYVSCGADSIFADPGTLTGSIGVYAGKLNRSGMYRKIGVNREFITRGQHALFFGDEGGFTPSERTLFEKQLAGFYDRFVCKVADGRHQPSQQIQAIAQGRVWTGNQGHANGLVDGLGGLLRALDSAKWSIGLTPQDHIALVTYGKPLSWLERMVIKSLRENGSRSHLSILMPPESSTRDAAATLFQVAGLAADQAKATVATCALLDGRPVAMAPFTIQWR